MSQLKFCDACGTSLAEGEKFCSKCGKAVVAIPAQPVVENQAQSDFTAPVQQAPQPAPYMNSVPVTNNGGAPKQGGKNVIALVGIAVAVIAVLVVGIIIFINVTKYQKIDAKELFKIEFKGINGSGVCVAGFNIPPAYGLSDSDLEYYNDIMEEYNDDENAKAAKKEEYSKYFSTEKKELLKAYDKAKSKSDAEDMRDALLNTDKKGNYDIVIDLSEDSNLSNGDKIKCEVIYDEDDLKEENIKLTNTEFEVEVKGLQEGVKLDLFDGFEVTYDGIDGDGYANYESENKKHSFIRYYSETSSYGLSNGDAFTVNAYIDLYDYDFVNGKDEKDGYYFEADGVTYIVTETSVTKDFTVEGLKGLEAIDLFEGVKIKYTGASPYIKYEDVNTDNCKDILKADVSYSVDDAYSNVYKVGDTITLKAYPYTSSMADAGFKPAGTPDSEGYYTKEFTIEAADASVYLDATATLADFADMNPLFEAEVSTYKDDLVGSSSIEYVSFGGKVKSVKSFDEINTYIAIHEDFAAGTLTSYETKVYAVKYYKIVVELEDGKSSTVYMYLALQEPIKGADGKVTVYDDIPISDASTKKEDLTNAFKSSKYVLNEIKSTGASTDDSSKADTSSAATDDSSSSSAATESEADSKAATTSSSEAA